MRPFTCDSTTYPQGSSQTRSEQTSGLSGSSVADGFRPRKPGPEQTPPASDASPNPSNSVRLEFGFHGGPRAGTAGGRGGLCPARQVACRMSGR
jgi:hypothetical protein